MTSKRRPPSLKTVLPRSKYLSAKYLPINVRREYNRLIHTMPPVPPYISDYVKEFIMTLNLARVHPVFFSNNVLEPLRNRVHHDLHYNSCS